MKPVIFRFLFYCLAVATASACARRAPESTGIGAAGAAGKQAAPSLVAKLTSADDGHAFGIGACVSIDVNVENDLPPGAAIALASDPGIRFYASSSDCTAEENEISQLSVSEPTVVLFARSNDPAARSVEITLMAGGAPVSHYLIDLAWVETVPESIGLASRLELTPGPNFTGSLPSGRCVVFTVSARIALPDGSAGAYVVQDGPLRIRVTDHLSNPAGLFFPGSACSGTAGDTITIRTGATSARVAYLSNISRAGNVEITATPIPASTTSPAPGSFQLRLRSYGASILGTWLGNGPIVDRYTFLPGGVCAYHRDLPPPAPGNSSPEDAVCSYVITQQSGNAVALLITKYWPGFGPEFGGILVRFTSTTTFDLQLGDAMGNLFFVNYRKQ